MVDTRGCASIVISEHHASDDGYLPSPLMLAGAVAAATQNTPIVVAVTILGLWDPVRLAEDIVTLDHLSQGRAMIVLGLGYRPVEYELYGKRFADRAPLADDNLRRLLDILDAADREADPVRVTPAPLSRPRPLLAWGGGSQAAARRAGRHGLGFFAQTDSDGLRQAYESAAIEAGHAPGMCVLPSPDAPYSVFVAEDVERGWTEVGPALLADAAAYRRWADEAASNTTTASLSYATSVEELRRSDAAHRVVTPDGARELVAEFGVCSLHPLCGGLDPDTAWPYLEKAVDALGTTPSP